MNGTWIRQQGMREGQMRSSSLTVPYIGALTGHLHKGLLSPRDCQGGVLNERYLD